MIARVVLVVLAVLTLVAFWFVWTNRASEKIVTSTVPIAILAIIGIFLAGWVFGGEDDYQVVFPVCFMVDLHTKLEIDNYWPFNIRRFTLGRSAGELKEQRPDLFPDEKNYFARNVYHHLLQRSFIDFLAMLYGGSWRARSLRFDIGTFNFGFAEPDPQDQQRPSRVLKASDIERALGSNWFAHIPNVLTPQLALRPGSDLIVNPPKGGGDDTSTSELRIKNDYCTISLIVESTVAIRTIGEYRLIAGLSDEAVKDLATIMYIVRAEIHYSRLRSGAPDMKLYKEWSKQLVDEIRKQFDEQLIWSRIKENDMRMRHYPPEMITPQGRFPQPLNR